VRFVYKHCAKNVSTSRISLGCKYPDPGDGFVAMCSNPIQLYFSEYVLDSRDPAVSSLSNGFDTLFSLAGKKQKKEKTPNKACIVGMDQKRTLASHQGFAPLL
jgi:hypothetical protein